MNEEILLVPGPACWMRSILCWANTASSLGGRLYGLRGLEVIFVLGWSDVGRIRYILPGDTLCLVCIVEAPHSAGLLCEQIQQGKFGLNGMEVAQDLRHRSAFIYLAQAGRPWTEKYQHE